MSDFAEASKKVKELKYRLRDNAEGGLERGMEGVEGSLKRHLRAGDSVARGEAGGLLSAIMTIPAPGIDRRAFTGQKIVAPNYWKYLEFGTGIYTGRGYKAPSEHAPVEDILTWVTAKGITPDPTSSYDSQVQLARAIAFSTSEGTEQHKFARPAWRGPFGREFVINSVMKSMEAAVDRTF